MPYYKKPYKRAPYARKPAYRRKPVTAKTVYKIAKKVHRTAGPSKETRMDVYKGMKTNVVADSFDYYDITNIPLGTTSDERLGNRVYIAGVKLNLSFAQSTAAIKTRYVRLMVVTTRNRDGDLLDLTSWSDLYTSSARADRAADGLAGDLTSPLNTDILTVYYDHLIKLQTNENGGAVLFSRYIPVKKLVTYDNDGTTAQPTNGRIYVIMHLAEADGTASANAVHSGGMLRIFYRDRT